MKAIHKISNRKLPFLGQENVNYIVFTQTKDAKNVLISNYTHA